VKGIPHTEVRSGLITSGFEPDTFEQKSCVQQLSHVNSANAVAKDAHKIPLTLSDSMPDLVRHYDFPVPDVFLDL
jgi:hypothetical protein